MHSINCRNCQLSHLGGLGRVSSLMGVSLFREKKDFAVSKFLRIFARLFGAQGAL